MHRFGHWVIAVDAISEKDYGIWVIQSYRDSDTRRVANRERCNKLPAGIQRRAQAKLMVLNNARDLNDLRVLPGNRLEALSGDRKGQHSIRINTQWRICFIWKRGNAYRVEIVDYH